MSCILMVALLLSLVGQVRATNARSRTIVERGIDVSVYQGNIDWDTLAKHVDFVIIRCGYGQDRESQDDLQWLNNVEACTRLNIPFGVYLYSYATTEEAARSEAEHVLRLIKGYNLALPVYIDVEDKYIENRCTDRQILSHVSIFCDIISEAGYTPGVYSNAYWWEHHLNYSEYDQWERWVAQWSDDLNFDRPYSMWQYSNKGRLPGIQGDVDLDYWYGRKLTDGCSHSYSSEMVQAPTCTEEGIVKYTCTACGNSYEERVSATGHDFTKTDSETAGVVKYVCTVCGESYEESVPPEEHSYTETVVQPTCTSDGIRKYTCSICGYHYEERIPALEHSFVETVVQPTCTSDGIRKHTCSVCNYHYEDRLPATGHSYTQTVVPPSTTQGGYTIYTCACGHSYIGDRQPCLNHIANNGILITPPTETESGEKVYYCVSCGELLRRETLPSAAEHRTQCPSASFVDVPPYMHWAHEGIDFGIRDSLFQGVGDNRFDPDGVMTRAMLVTVLWRMAGRPTATRPSGFVDVEQGTWYSDAVAWAQEQELVNGIGNGRFDPAGVITREQFASILYRFLASETLAEVPEGNLARFPDANAVSDYAKTPFSWAVHEGYVAGTIIGGYTVLDPQGAVTRAQAATILQRLPRN